MTTLSTILIVFGSIALSLVGLCIVYRVVFDVAVALIDSWQNEEYEFLVVQVAIILAVSGVFSLVAGLGIESQINKPAPQAERTQ